MRVAIYQATGSRHRTAANAAAIEQAAADARQKDAQVLVTPELFLSSYSPRDVSGEDAVGSRLFLSSVAFRYNMWVVGSTVECANGRSYITASLFDPRGQEVTRYRKRNLFGEDERAVFHPGEDEPEIVEINGWAVALGICFDVEFPEFVRDVAVRGAELLLVPTAVPLRQPSGDVPNPLNTRQLSLMVVPTRAFESQLYIAYANQIEPLFSGASVLADPFGRRVVTASSSEELVVGDVDRDVLQSARRAVDYLPIIRRRNQSNPASA